MGKRYVLDFVKNRYLTVANVSFIWLHPCVRGGLHVLCMWRTVMTAGYA